MQFYVLLQIPYFWLYQLPCLINIIIWVKVFKNEPSKICGRQPLKESKYISENQFTPAYIGQGIQE